VPHHLWCSKGGCPGANLRHVLALTFSTRVNGRKPKADRKTIPPPPPSQVPKEIIVMYVSLFYQKFKDEGKEDFGLLSYPPPPSLSWCYRVLECSQKNQNTFVLLSLYLLKKGGLLATQLTGTLVAKISQVCGQKQPKNTGVGFHRFLEPSVKTTRCLSLFNGKNHLWDNSKNQPPQGSTLILPMRLISSMPIRHPVQSPRQLKRNPPRNKWYKRERERIPKAKRCTERKEGDGEGRGA